MPPNESVRGFDPNYMTDITEATGSEGRANTPLTPETPLQPKLTMSRKVPRWKTAATSAGLALAGLLGHQVSPAEAQLGHGAPKPTITVRDTELFPIGIRGNVHFESVPTAKPTSIATGVPTGEPTGIPTDIPTGVPTGVPSAEPTGIPTAVPTEVQQSHENVVKAEAKVAVSLSRSKPIWERGDKISPDGKGIAIRQTYVDSSTGRVVHQVRMADGSSVYVENSDLVTPLTPDKYESPKPLPDGLIEYIQTGVDDAEVPLNLTNTVELFGSKIHVGEGQDLAYTFEGRAKFDQGSTAMRIEGPNGTRIEVTNTSAGHAIAFKIGDYVQAPVVLRNPFDQQVGILSDNEGMFDFNTRVEAIKGPDGNRIIRPINTATGETYKDKYGVEIVFHLPEGVTLPEGYYKATAENQGSSLRFKPTKISLGVARGIKSTDYIPEHMKNGGIFDRTGVSVAVGSYFLTDSSFLIEHNGVQELSALGGWHMFFEGFRNGDMALREKGLTELRMQKAYAELTGKTLSIPVVMTDIDISVDFSSQAYSSFIDAITSLAGPNTEYSLAFIGSNGELNVARQVREKFGASNVTDAISKAAILFDQLSGHRGIRVFHFPFVKATGFNGHREAIQNIRNAGISILGIDVNVRGGSAGELRTYLAALHNDSLPINMYYASGRAVAGIPSIASLCREFDCRMINPEPGDLKNGPVIVLDIEGEQIQEVRYNSMDSDGNPVTNSPADTLIRGVR